jgi:hypothetical protein
MSSTGSGESSRMSDSSSIVDDPSVGSMLDLQDSRYEIATTHLLLQDRAANMYTCMNFI